MSEVYIATVIETDGPIPGPHSMLSLASAAYQRDKTLVSSFNVNLEALPDAAAAPDMLAWWKSKPDAWNVCRHEPEPIGAAMREYRDWLHHLPGKPVFVGYPAARDFMFVTWYLHRFADDNPFGPHCLDLRSFAMALLHKPYRHTLKRHMPPEWIEDIPSHTFVAMDDALSVGTLLCKMLDTWDERAGQHPPVAADGDGLRLRDDTDERT